MDSKVQYPWQQTVLDAFIAPPEILPLKIKLAERAVAARLSDAELGHYERIALRDALNVLHVLIAESRVQANLKAWTPDPSIQSLKYVWQEAVFDAFVELRPGCLPEKVNAAQRAIYRRLSDPAVTDSLRELSPKHLALEESKDKQ